jgi:hypothetical protein
MLYSDESRSLAPIEFFFASPCCRLSVAVALANGAEIADLCQPAQDAAADSGDAPTSRAARRWPPRRLSQHFDSHAERRHHTG